MGNGAVLLPLHHYINTITADTEEPTNPVTNLLNGIPSETYISINHTCIIIIEFTQSVTITGVSLHNHNFPKIGTTIQVRFSSDGITYPDYEDLSWNEKNTWLGFEYTAKFMRLWVEIPEGDGNQVSIGEFFPGVLWEFPTNFEWGYQPIGKIQKDVMTVNGQTFQTAISKSRGWNLNFSQVPPENWNDFYRLLEADYRVFIPDIDLLDCAHGTFTNDTFSPSRQPGGDSFALEFSENACIE